VPSPACSEVKCCVSPLAYYASSDSSNYAATETKILGLADGAAPNTIDITGDTTKIRTYSFYLYARNEFGSEGKTQVTVDVVFNCASDVISFSKVSPSVSEKASFGSKAIFDMQADGTYNLVVALQAGDAFEADISSRFAHTAPTGSCSISAY